MCAYGSYQFAQNDADTNGETPEWYIPVMEAGTENPIMMGVTNLKA